MRRNKVATKSTRYWLPAIVIAVAVAIVTITKRPPSTSELQQASAEVASPCYYFCGPWYTWLITWIGATLLFAVIASWTVYYSQGGEDDAED